MIKSYQAEDLERCARALAAAYEGEPWHNHWTLQGAYRYLKEFCGNPRFVGFTVWEGEQLAGAAFCHERTWWTNDELYVDELFVTPEHQRKGHGRQLLTAIQERVRRHGLAGITLLTDRRMPAPQFYRSQGFADAEHVLFMYQVL